jgi:hypothetical protein
LSGIKNQKFTLYLEKRALDVFLSMLRNFGVFRGLVLVHPVPKTLHQESTLEKK